MSGLKIQEEQWSVVIFTRHKNIFGLETLMRKKVVAKWRGVVRMIVRASAVSHEKIL